MSCTIAYRVLGVILCWIFLPHGRSLLQKTLFEHCLKVWTYPTMIWVLFFSVDGYFFSVENFSSLQNSPVVSSFVPYAFFKILKVSLAMKYHHLSMYFLPEPVWKVLRQMHLSIPELAETLHNQTRLSMRVAVPVFLELVRNFKLLYEKRYL